MTHLEIPKDFVVLRSCWDQPLDLRGLGLGSLTRPEFFLTWQAGRPSTLMGNTSSSCSLPEGKHPISRSRFVGRIEKQLRSYFASLFGHNRVSTKRVSTLRGETFLNFSFFPLDGRRALEKPKKIDSQKPKC